MFGGDARGLARFAAVHAALAVAIWLAGVVVYAFAFASNPSFAWALVDIAAIGGCVAVVHRWGGKRAWARLAIVIAFALACVTAMHAVIADGGGVWVDESNYLRTVREGIVRDGVLPFNLRWLAPTLAGSCNVLPVDDVDALKAVNFGAFVVTAVYLALLLVRLGVRFGHALFAPVFLLCSYLGVYGAFNRLVIDPFNYAAFVILFHTLVRRDHWPLFSVALLIAAFNSEKAIYWVPIFALVALVRAPLTWRHVWQTAWLALRYAAPALVYLLAIAFYLRGSDTVEAPSFVENLHVMAFSWLAPKITNATVAANNFQILWFPFGAFTIYALLGLYHAARWHKPIVLLLVPIFAQALIAYDTQRMIAYAFIVYLPLGFVYLARVFADVPRVFAAAVFALMIMLAVAQYYLLPLKLLPYPGLTRLVLATAEIVLTATVIFVHATFHAAPLTPPGVRGVPSA